MTRTYATVGPTDLSGYVPYVGATADVDLGARTLSSGGLTVLGISAYIHSILKVDPLTGLATIGDYYSDAHNTYIAVDDGVGTRTITMSAQNGYTFLLPGTGQVLINSEPRLYAPNFGLDNVGGTFSFASGGTFKEYLSQPAVYTNSGPFYIDNGSGTLAAATLVSTSIDTGFTSLSIDSGSGTIAAGAINLPSGGQFYEYGGSPAVNTVSSSFFIDGGAGQLAAGNIVCTLGYVQIESNNLFTDTFSYPGDTYLNTGAGNCGIGIGPGYLSGSYRLEVAGNGSFGAGSYAQINLNIAGGGLAPEIDFVTGGGRNMVFGYDPNVPRGIFYSDDTGQGVFFRSGGIGIGGIGLDTLATNVIQVPVGNKGMFIDPTYTGTYDGVSALQLNGDLNLQKGLLDNFGSSGGAGQVLTADGAGGVNWV